jgi:hypothetical protein
MRASLQSAAVQGVIAMFAVSCGGEGGVPPPPEEPPAPPPARVGEDPRAKLPPERLLDQDRPACCPDLLGGWRYSRTAAPGSEVVATLSSPGPDPSSKAVKVDADVRFGVTKVTAQGRRLRVIRERTARVDIVKGTVPYLEVRLPRDAPAYYALEVEFIRDGRSLDRYVSYVDVPPQQAAVALQLDRGVARPGTSLELAVENRGPTALEFGLAYRLERWEGRWRWLNRDQAFILVAVGVRPGERYEQKVVLPADLEPGRYRVAKSFTARAADRELEAGAQFDVQ